MPVSRGLNLVLCWHMHQPQYQRPADGVYQQPWVYLHGIKDYVDMAAHIEAIAGARAVVNFSPMLLDQIADYEEQIRHYMAGTGVLRDPLLAALVGEWPLDGAERSALAQACLRANKRRVIDRFPAFQRLASLAAVVGEDPVLGHYLSDGYLQDLVVWYHLGWLGETVRRTDDRVDRLMRQEYGFNEESGRVLLSIVGEVLAGLVPRYRKLAEAGQVELSFTPYSHPIIPLLLDFSAAREAQPDVVLPASPSYPGGKERARVQIREGQAGFARHFGLRAQGCWPAEGGLSDGTLELLSEAGIQWTATGERVLRNTMNATGEAWAEASRHRAYSIPGHDLRCFFRDDGLSDLIGFSYADWHADDAVANLIEHLENIARTADPEVEPLVSIIMDGENAWEYYPENAYHFLRALYQRLADHPDIRLTTFSQYLKDGPPSVSLPPLVAGSWVNGTFATWMGDPDKNTAWDILVQAKETYDRVLASGRLSPADGECAAKVLSVCEGSDWCWWFGDYNPPLSVLDFERLYRRHVQDLYRILGEAPPALLLASFVSKQGDPSARGGAMRTSEAL